MKNNVFVKSIIAELNNLEELGGPESLEEYVKVLATVKAEIETRMEAVKDSFDDENMVTVCVHCLEQTSVVRVGDESFTTCESCQLVEGATKEMTERAYEAI